MQYNTRSLPATLRVGEKRGRMISREMAVTFAEDLRTGFFWGRLTIAPNVYGCLVDVGRYNFVGIDGAYTATVKSDGHHVGSR